MKIIEDKKESGAYKHIWELRPLREYLNERHDPWKGIKTECAKALGYWKPNPRPNSKIEGWVDVPKTKNAYVKLGEAMEAKGLDVEVRKVWLHRFPHYCRL